MPSVLRDFGVTEAIDNLILQIKASTGLDIEFDHYLKKEDQLPEAINTALYRIAQEALNNILRHANASEVRISLTLMDGWLSFFVSDNGRGCDPKTLVYGSGIRNMKERVRLLNGTFNFDSKTDGTTIEIEIPLNAN
jgi:signal transduction histidine kinase